METVNLLNLPGIDGPRGSSNRVRGTDGSVQGAVAEGRKAATELNLPVGGKKLPVSSLLERDGNQSTEAVATQIESLNGLLEVKNLGITFELNEAVSLPVIEVVDRDTERVLRQIPPEEFVTVAEKLQDFLERASSGGSAVSAPEGQVLDIRI